MKKIISLFLTIAMLAAMIVMPASAEGNAALFYDGAYLEADGSNFTQSYCYSVNGADTPTPYMQRNRTTGDFDMTMIFDFKITDVGSDDSANVGFDVTPDMHSNMNYHFGYDFNNKQFVVYRSYMPGGSITSESKVFKTMSYDMPLNEWHEFAIRATTGRTFQMYLDGILMLEITWNDIFVADEGNINRYDWEWSFESKNSEMVNDRWWLTLLETDMYIDNLSVYSGDYNFGTGTATSAYCTETEFANLMEGADSTGFGPFSCSQGASCPFFYSANGGTEKVTYDRDFAANHTHAWVQDTANSKTAHCLTPGYDLYTCTCGASEQRNYVEPHGHLPGVLISEDIIATETASGVQTRKCNRCMQTYKLLLNLTGETDKALHMYTKGGSGNYNGYFSVPNSKLMLQDDGVTVIADIMPISQIMKSYTSIGATMGGCGDKYFIGYDYNLAKFVIKNGDTILDESDKALNNYEWAEWMWHRDGYTVSLSIDGEEILTAELDELTYDLDGADGEANHEIEATHFFLFKCPAVEILLDNVIISGPDYDVENRTGIIYDMVTFNNNDYVTTDMFIDGFGNGAQFIKYNKGVGEGYQVEAHGLPTEDVIRVHRDMALKIDSDYETGSVGGYSQYVESEHITANDQSQAGLDFEYSFDFYAYDWCTDETILNKDVMGTDTDGNPIVTDTINGSAFIGGHVNSNCNEAEGNGFIGYDFIRQQAVIGSVSTQAGGEYREDSVFADYKIEKNTWHRYTFKYKFNVDTNLYELSILIDGNNVLTSTTEFVTISYYIYFPNFVKGYQDNLTVKLGGVTIDDNVDYTNAFDTKTAAMDFSSGASWSLVPGGVPTHVYDKQIFPASCTTDGYTIYTCSCGDSTYTAYDQIAQGHSWDKGVVTTEPTTTTEGVITYTCTSCYETREETLPMLKPAFTYGDVNGDGKIAAADLSLLMRYVGGATGAAINADASDVNGDGSIKANDVSVLSRKLGGANVVLGPAA